MIIRLLLCGLVTALFIGGVGLVLWEVAKRLRKGSDDVPFLDEDGTPNIYEAGFRWGDDVWVNSVMGEPVKGKLIGVNPVLKMLIVDVSEADNCAVFCDERGLLLASSDIDMVQNTPRKKLIHAYLEDLTHAN